MTAGRRPATAGLWSRYFVAACLLAALAEDVFAAGTPAGTVIESSATVSFDLSGTPVSLDSNVASITVAERLDVVVSLVSPQLSVSPGDTNRPLLFTLTNTGNGSESFALAVDSALAGDDFDPVASVPAIWFDSDASGDLTPADTAYQPGVNDPLLAADATIDVLIVNDIPATVSNGQTGLSALNATAATGSGAPGSVLNGQGDGGVDAVVGSTGAESEDTGEYLVSDVELSIVKTQVVSDTFGGTEPLPGATITYTLSVEVIGAGTATAAVLRDAIPQFTTFVAGSLSLNALSLSDQADADAGELDAAGPQVVVRLGDLTQANGVQTITFQVTID